MGGETINPLTGRQRRTMREFQDMIRAELGQTFDMPSYLPEWNQNLNDVFGLAGEIAGQGFSDDITGATQRLLGGDMGYQIDPAMREQYFQAQMAPANIAFQDNLRMIAEQYAGGGAGRSGDFQFGLAEAAARRGAENDALLAGLINEDEIRNWEAGQNALQRMPQAIELGQYQQLMPLNTLMNAGLTQYGLDSERAQMEAQQQIYSRDALANPYIAQWLPMALSPYRVPASGGGGGMDPMSMMMQMGGSMLGGSGGLGGILGSLGSLF